MKTDDLIKLLSEDAPVKFRLSQVVPGLLCVGGLFSLLLLLVTVGLRPDMSTALFTPRVAAKIVTTLMLALLACRLILPVGRPGAPVAGHLKALLLPVGLLLLALVTEAAVTPVADWKGLWIGAHPLFCLFFIPVLSVAPLGAVLIALRRGAPDDPGLAGAAAGLAAGTMAAAVYAWHCTDDSPFFVASWYGLAILLVTVAGYGLGQRLLRW